MYGVATNPARSATGRRSTRSARGSTKRRRGDDDGRRLSRLQKNSGPARKWVQVMRPPAPHIKFLVEKWVPMESLTESERQEYEQKIQLEEQKRQEQMAADAAAADGAEQGKSQDSPVESGANADAANALEDDPMDATSFVYS